MTVCTLTFAKHTIILGPERVYCRRQLRSNQTFSHTFSYFFAIDLCIDFLMHFYKKWHPKTVRQVIMQWTFCVTFSEHFPKIDFRMHFGGPLAPLWLPLAPFCLPLAMFRLLLGTIWRTFVLHFLTFESPSAIFYILIRNQKLRTYPIIWQCQNKV